MRVDRGLAQIEPAEAVEATGERDLTQGPRARVANKHILLQREAAQHGELRSTDAAREMSDAIITDEVVAEVQATQPAQWANDVDCMSKVAQPVAVDAVAC